MEGLVYWLLSGTNFCFFLFGLLLVTQPSKFKFRRRLLGTGIIIFAWYMFLAQMVITRLLADHFYLLRSGVIFYYLLPPLIFLYVRVAYSRSRNFEKYDWLHLIPALLACIDLIPYIFFGDVAVKQAELATFIKDPGCVKEIGRGILVPAIVHYHLRTLQGLVYMYFAWKIVRKYAKMNVPATQGPKFFTIVFTFLYVGNFCTTMAMLHDSTWYEFYNLNTPYDYIYIVLIIGLMVMCVFLFIQPPMLGENMSPAGGHSSSELSEELRDDKEIRSPVLIYADSTKPELKAELKPELSKVFLDSFLPRLEELMTSTQIFRQPGITSIDVAQKLGIAPHLLSSVINKHYQQRFNDFINQRRIEYVIHLIRSDDNWKQYTIEGLSIKAGFSSRAPFYAAFKKITGKTPSEYMNQVGK